MASRKGLIFTVEMGSGLIFILTVKKRKEKRVIVIKGSARSDYSTKKIYQTFLKLFSIKCHWNQTRKC